MIVTSPRLADEASGMLKVTPVDDVAMLKSVPAVPVANAKVVVARPLIEVVENEPPDPPEIPSDDVATQRVEVPVERSTMPCVPEAFVESRKRPERVRLVAKRLVVLALKRTEDDAYNTDVVPTLIFPAGLTENIEVPVEDEISNGLTPD